MTIHISINDGIITNATEGEDLTAQISQPRKGDEWIGWTTSDNGVTFTAPPTPIIPTPPTVYRSLTKLEFVTLCQTAGGMTDDELVASRTDARLAALWVKLDLSTSVDHGNAMTEAGLDALHTLGYLPNGKDGVLAAWPTA